MYSSDLSPPIDDFPTQDRPPSIYDAIDANDFDLALRVITDNPAAIESVDGIPPPLHHCIYDDKPDMLEWLLDHGADIERREQDYGSTVSFRQACMNLFGGVASVVGFRIWEDHHGWTTTSRRSDTAGTWARSL